MAQPANEVETQMASTTQYQSWGRYPTLVPRSVTAVRWRDELPDLAAMPTSVLPYAYGRSYGDRFAALFAEVAKSQGTALVPFMLKGVADIPLAEAMFQADRIHPVARAHPIILGNVWPVLEPLLR